jgi:hypothetical protein
MPDNSKFNTQHSLCSDFTTHKCHHKEVFLKKGTNRSAGQQISRLLWNVKVHLPCSQEPQLELILIGMNPVCSVRPYFFKISLIIIVPSTPGFPSCVFPFGFPTEMYAFLIYPKRAPYKNKIVFSFEFFYNKTSVKCTLVFNGE